MPRLEPGMARIRVKDLRLRTYIGINEDEIINKQDVLINLTILYAAQDAVRDNDIDHALNYRTITKAIIRHVEDNRFALLEKLTQMPYFGMAGIKSELMAILDAPIPQTILSDGRTLNYDKMLVMGILNITPDSFYAGSRVPQLEQVVEKAGEMLRQGAAVLDIGGESTRPGSDAVTADEEQKRMGN